MISLHVEKILYDAARLREIGYAAGDVRSALENARAEYETAWRGGAGEAFQAFAGKLCEKLAAFRGEADDLADCVARIGRDFSETDENVF
jgi:uncharacterized protein YukE